MKNEPSNNQPRLWTITFFILFFILAQSCGKSDPNGPSSTKVSVKVSPSVGKAREERITVGSSSSHRRNIGGKEVVSKISLSQNLYLDVELIDDQLNGKSQKSLRADLVKKKKSDAQVFNEPLAKGVKYRVSVYDVEGNFVESHDYISGLGGSEIGFPLDAGKTYTFIVYSVNSKTDLPEIAGKASLSTARLENISGDLMFFKKSINLKLGQNEISAVLQHQFSQLTTSIEMDNSMTGYLEGLSSVRLEPTKSSADLRLADGKLNYPSTSVNSIINFSKVTKGLRSLTSEPTIVISPSTVEATMVIGSITIDSETKINISIPNVKIVPGHRYTLLLRFRTCSEDVTSDGLNWNYPETKWWEGIFRYTGIYKTDEKKYYKNNEVIENTFLAPQANYGFQFDITEFDNAFNLRVNGQYIFGNSSQDQIQFETFRTLGIVRNIQFVDGSEYATGGIDEIYNLAGTLQTPLIRVLISRQGEVNILGSKTNNGPLFPLKLKDGLSFNRIHWNTTGPNTVVVTQKVSGRTIVIGKGSGKKRISCKE